MNRRRNRRLNWQVLRKHWRAIAAAGAIVASALSVIAVAAWSMPRVWYSIGTHPYFAIAEVTVRGNSRATRATVIEWAGVRLGMSLWDAEPEVIQARLLTHPTLVQASVRRDFPRRLVVQVRERIPVAIAAMDDALYYVDRGGQVMERLASGDSRDFAVITGVRWVDFSAAGSVMVRRAVRLVRLCQREGCGGGVAEIHVDGDRGVTLVPVRRPIAIFLGWGNWRTKLARTTRVLESWQGQEARVALLDASFHNQVVVRLRDVPATKSPPAKARVKAGVKA